MSQTASDLQTQLAYRLGESSSPSDSTTTAIRLEWLNQGYFLIARRRNWYWLEATDSTNTNTGSTTGYAEPTDLKEFIELQIDGVYYDQKPYKQNRDDVNTIVSLPSTRLAFEFYRFGGRYYLVPEDAGDAVAHNIKYYKRVTKRTASDTFLIPDEFLEALVAYAEGRYWLSISQQSKAAVPFQEFEEMLKEMEREQNRRGWGQKKMSTIREPEDVYY
jgi:hypothetical protein